MTWYLITNSLTLPLQKGARGQARWRGALNGRRAAGGEKPHTRPRRCCVAWRWTAAKRASRLLCPGCFARNRIDWEPGKGSTRTTSPAAVRGGEPAAGACPPVDVSITRGGYCAKAAGPSFLSSLPQLAAGPRSSGPSPRRPCRGPGPLTCAFARAHPSAKRPFRAGRGGPGWAACSHAVHHRPELLCLCSADPRVCEDGQVLVSHELLSLAPWQHSNNFGLNLPGLGLPSFMAGLQLPGTYPYSEKGTSSLSPPG